jgi:hypothetical protein
MAFPGLVKANNLSDIADKEKAWDNLGLAINYPYDPSSDLDFQAYINAVEAADGASLEPEVKVAIFSFITECKLDGTWNAIKASCILAGARTLAGALVPLVGAAPTNVGGLFVAGDYNRKTGLVGNAGSKYLLSNRFENSDPQNNFHISTYVTQADTNYALAPARFLMGTGRSDFNCFSHLLVSSSAIIARVKTGAGVTIGGTFASMLGFIGASRSAVNSYGLRRGNNTLPASDASASPSTNNIAIFRDSQLIQPTNARLAFYSIGESLDLALLDTRVTALINAFAAILP